MFECIFTVQYQSKERKKVISLEKHKLLPSPKAHEILVSQINDEINQGPLHLKLRNDTNHQYFH